MAKKPRNPIEADDEEQLALEFIPAPKLKTLMGKVKSATKDKDAAVATLRGHIAKAVENSFLDKTGFALYRKFEAMDDEDAHRVFSHFMHMMTVSGELDRAMTPPKKEDEITPPKMLPSARDETNLVQLGRGRRRVVEEVA